MDVGLCYSGGRDSTLAALLLDSHARVTCLGCTFGVTDGVEQSRRCAEAIGLPFETVRLDESVARSAVSQLVDDGFPRNGIQQVHEHALETVAARDLDVVADGTRRDDRSPTVPRSLAQRIEDTHGVSHVAPLAGFGHGAVEMLAEDLLVLERGPSEDLRTGDYESELRALVAESHGRSTVREVFPDHEQSRVIGLRGE